MVSAIEDIKDKDSLKAWLEAFPGTDQEKRQAAVFIATRAAARVLPRAWEHFEYHPEARKRDVTEIPILGNLLISGVAAKMPTPDIRAFAAAAAAADDAFAFAFAADAAADAFAFVAADAVWKNIRKDCAQIAKHTDDEVRFSIFARDLWDGGDNPFLQDWAELKSKLGAATDVDWSFWINWYDDLLQGREPNWHMLYEVATSEAIEWEASNAEVNAAIGGIVDKHRLLGEVRALKAEKEAYISSMATEAHRSHNMPPEGLVDDEPRRVITMLWDALDDAEDALDTPEPEPSRLRQIGEKIVEIAVAIAKYCGQKADLFISEAVKETGKAAGKWGAGATAVYLAAQTDPARALGNGIIQLVENLAKIGFGG